jgi:hypothetical protein
MYNGTKEWLTSDEETFIDGLSPGLLAKYVEAIKHRENWAGMDKVRIAMYAIRRLRYVRAVTL